MSLFPVPGWSMTSNPIPTSKPVSKKRKRPSTNSDKLQSAEINLEKLVKKLKNDSTTLIDGREARDKTLPKNRKTKRSQETKNRTETDRSKPASPKEEHSEKNRTGTPSTTLTKQKSRKQDKASVADPQGAISGLTSLQQTMKQSLDGARFRIINEQLYKTSSTQAHEMVRADPHVYEEYHTGFRRQVQLWPTNPVEHYIALLSTYPPRTVIADLGCGDAAVARNLIPKGITVLSFDLVSDNEYVVEADICSKVPLPGSEPSSDDGSTGSAQIVDVVVCALSLMGTNWPNCLREAWRILKADGELKIAEVASRFRSVDEFQALVASIGFQLKSKDTSNSHFSLFEFKKVPCGRKSEKEWANLSSKGGILKACEYKRR